MDALVAATLPHALLPLVVMEFPGITVGGGFSGTSGESSSFRHGPFDAPPFPWLQDGGTAVALFITVLILITQRRENELAEHREQLTLELAILSEKKSAKIIELLEELRRDMPTVRQRDDAEAAEMARPADPQAVLQAITETHEAERER